MSLIQEALRRQQEEESARQRAPAAGGPPPPSVPTAPVAPPTTSHMSLSRPKPPPAPEQAPAPVGGGKGAGPNDRQGKGGAKAVLGIVAALVCLVLVLAGLVWGGWRLYAARALGSGAVTGGATGSATGALAGATQAVPVSVDMPGQTATRAPGTGVAGVVAIAVPATPTGTGVVAVAGGNGGGAPSNTVTSGGTTNTGGATGNGHQTPPPQATKIKWPAITLTGFIGGSDSGMAILNGQMVAVGESIQGVTVRGIVKQSVRLEFMGATRLLRQGQTTEP
jgi:hypothetical protein